MRNQQVDARAVAAEVEAGRQDADDPERLGLAWTGLRFSANQPSDRAGIGSETVAPECVADERDRLGSGREIVADRPASGSDTHTAALDESASDPHAAQRLRIAAIADVERLARR
jgi:hypothetical protein